MEAHLKILIAVSATFFVAGPFAYQAGNGPGRAKPIDPGRPILRPPMPCNTTVA